MLLLLEEKIAFVSIMADTPFMKLADFPPTTTPVIPTKADLELARRSKNQLEVVANNHPDIALRVHSQGKKQVTIPIPATVLKLLIKILTEMAAGNAVAILPLHREMTTQQAADFLEMSRPSLVKLLDQKKMRFRMVGKHRRIFLQDLLEYKKQAFIESCAALDELAQQAQELGLGY